MFYVVKKGKIPGIYNSWEEIRPLVSQFSGADYKKFKILSEAKAYLNQETNNNLNKNLISEKNSFQNNYNNTLENFFTKNDKINKKNLNLNKKYNNSLNKNENKIITYKNDNLLKENTILKYLENKTNENDKKINNNLLKNEKINKINLKNKNSFSDFLNVYTDGSCLNNGKNRKKGCGFAAIFKDFEEYNYFNDFDIGDKTNNRAELFAIIWSIRIFLKICKEKNFSKDNKKLLIHTDSEYCIKCINGLKKWRLQNWKGVKNIDLLKILYEECENCDWNFKLQHVRAHQTDKSEDTYYNNLADKYARDMALSQMN